MFRNKEKTRNIVESLIAVREKIALYRAGFLIGAVVLLGGIEHANGATITVGPGAGYDFDSIQAGIDVANGGDTVLVAPGEYVVTVPITFRGKAITVRLETGPDETTIRMGTPTDSNRGSVVVFENDETAASVLDGFTITGGRGCWRTDPYPPANRWSGLTGGGILCWEASPTIIACTIIKNAALHGGGVACLNSHAILTDCMIAENEAAGTSGGAASLSGSSLILTNCTIKDNSARKFGGGVHCWDNSSVTMAGCIISGNSVTGGTVHEAGYGGGLFCGDSSMLTLTNCSIAQNSAGIGGGGMFLVRSPSTMTDCIISGNSAGLWGGGVGCEKGAMLLSMTNCVIARNAGGQGGGGVGCAFGAVLTVSNCTIWGNSGGSTWGGGGVLCSTGSAATVTNSILRQNTAYLGREISLMGGSTLDITYSNIAGGQAEANIAHDSVVDWGTSNIDADPLFARLGYWDDKGTRDPSDDFWVADDYHLKSQAGRWDPDGQTWVQDDVTSPCIDAGDPMRPIGWEPFPNGGFVNMGAYGCTAEASKSYFAEPICETIVAGDINGDCQVNRADLEIMALHWTDDEPLLP